MNSSRFLKAIGEARRQFDPGSLRVRLTVGIAAVSAAGLGSFAIWTSWQMQQILIGSHKQHIEYMAERLPRDVELYSEMWPTEIGLKKAIDNLTTPYTLLWIKRLDGTIAAESEALKLPADRTAAALMSFTQMPIRAQVYKVNERNFVLCSQPLQVRGKALGQLFVAQDVTREQMLFLAVVRSVGIASVLTICVMTGAIAIYIQRALQPLRQLSQLAGNISADDLGRVQLQLELAPSEVKELAYMWDIMLTRLAAAWEQQRQFTSNVSHELRTPLTIVHGYLQSLLRRGTNLTEPQREALEIAALEADRTIRLLQDLLDLARAESGYLLESLVLNDAVAEVVGMAEQFSQRVVFVDANVPVKVMADRDRLKQVLLNLLDNALKYSDSGESVILHLSQMGEQALIEVSDKGCGIPLQHQSRIFERFYRVDEARTRTTGGYGLGLSIVKTLVESMGGSVSVRSQLGEGSTFTVTLQTIS